MDEKKAEKISKMLGGYAFQSGGGLWVVIVEQKKHIAVISEECISTYKSADNFVEGDDFIDTVVWLEE